MPERPYRVLYANLPFYSDSDCVKAVEGATLIVLRCEDPRQRQQPIECMPTTRNYGPGQIVSWELNNKRLWDLAWYRNPESGKIEKAWAQAVEFIGDLVKAEGGSSTAEAGSTGPPSMTRAG